MKVIAMYLPQFHRVKENDEWWGDGFTEWTSVKSAKKLFPEHEQPNVPLNHRYYDLMNPETMRWQAGLMHQYGVDGMGFYHYYFKDGRRILERPAENLLHWKDIDMPFCFSWANESWVRSWSRLTKQRGNPWFAKFDPEGARDDDGILLEQSYGGEDAWRAHFAYLSSFFHDRRYILHDNQPLFLIYKPRDIPCLREMLQLWDKLAQEEGFDGVYAIGSNIEEYQQLGLKGAMLQEPRGTVARFVAERNRYAYQVRTIYDYEKAWQQILNRPISKEVSQAMTIRRGAAMTVAFMSIVRQKSLEGECVRSLKRQNETRLLLSSSMHGMNGERACIWSRMSGMDLRSWKH